MKTKKPLTAEELKFWKAAFLVAELPLLAKNSEPMNPQGLAHLAYEYADAAVTALRARLATLTEEQK